LEGTYGWEWLAELREEAGYYLQLPRPLRTRAIASARVKTDATDAKTLAHLPRAGRDEVNPRHNFGFELPK
jgi:hypothetical protein